MRFEERVPSRAGCQSGSPQSGESTLYKLYYLPYTLHAGYTQSISIHHSQSSQSIPIYDREIGAKISVSVSISRFLRLHTLLYRL